MTTFLPDLNDKDIKARFGRTMQRLRRSRTNLSQEAFGYHLGCHRTYVSQIERGFRSPTLTMICKIARGLGMPPWELLREMDEEVAESEKE